MSDPEKQAEQGRTRAQQNAKVRRNGSSCTHDENRKSKVTEAKKKTRRNRIRKKKEAKSEQKTTGNKNSCKRKAWKDKRIKKAMQI